MPIFLAMEFDILSDGKLSPVKMLSSTEMLKPDNKRQSAGTISPASIIIMSPLTRFSELISLTSPSLLTRALALDNLDKSATICSALYSCQVPIKAFKIR